MAFMLASRAAFLLISRLTDIHPGVILGVIAGAAIAGDDPRQHGPIIFVPMLGLLVLSLAALIALEPLRSLAGDSPEWYGVIPETVAVTVFVAGIEGLLFNLLPLTFMEGRKVWECSTAVVGRG